MTTQLGRTFSVQRKADVSKIYPWFPINANSEIIPEFPLPNNFRDIIPIFYREGGKQKLEDYVFELQRALIETPLCDIINLNWDNTLGLTRINLGLSSSFFLDSSADPKFKGQNTGIYSIVEGTFVITKYVAELMRLQ